ncbi:hypothetical protein [Nocardia sp. NPDC048505]|uniref:WXG100-like domain-containing protein n=1 Tax=unclassified Nocardia TaxID=2637762 RepID=UPI003408BA83
MGIEIPDSLQWVAKYVVGAGDWPEGDETAMRRVEDAWTGLATTLTDLDDEATYAVKQAIAQLDGSTGEAFAAHWDKLGGGKGAFDGLIKTIETLADEIGDGAADIEHTKLVIIASLVIFAIEMAIALAEMATGVGAPAGAATAAAAQTATRIAIRVALKALLKRILSKAALKAAARAALKGAWSAVLEEGFLEIGLKLAQVAVGNRDALSKEEWLESGATIAAAAAAGATEGALTSGSGSPGGNKLTSALKDGAQEVGAGLAGEVAAAATTAALTDQPFDLSDTFSLENITSSVAGAGQSALENGGGNNNPGETNPAGANDGGEQGNPGDNNPGEQNPSNPADTTPAGSNPAQPNPGQTTPAGTNPNGGENPSQPGQTQPTEPGAQQQNQQQPTQPTEPSTQQQNQQQPTEPAAQQQNQQQPSQPTEPAAQQQNQQQPTEPAAQQQNQQQPSQPTEPAAQQQNQQQPTQPTEPASQQQNQQQPSQPTEPAAQQQNQQQPTQQQPTQTTEPSAQQQNQQPSQPSTPQQPTQPTEPSTQQNQQQPTQPSAPSTQPTEPSTQQQPTQPSTPQPSSQQPSPQSPEGQPAQQNPAQQSPSQPTTGQSAQQPATPQSPNSQPAPPQQPAQTTEPAQGQPANTQPTTGQPAAPSSPATQSPANQNPSPATQNPSPTTPSDSTPASPATTAPAATAPTSPSTPATPAAPNTPATPANPTTATQPTSTETTPAATATAPATAPVTGLPSTPQSETPRSPSTPQTGDPGTAAGPNAARPNNSPSPTRPDAPARATQNPASPDTTRPTQNSANPDSTRPNQNPSTPGVSPTRAQQSPSSARPDPTSPTNRQPATPDNSKPSRPTPQRPSRFEDQNLRNLPDTRAPESEPRRTDHGTPGNPTRPTLNQTSPPSSRQPDRTPPGDAYPKRSAADWQKLFDQHKYDPNSTPWNPGATNPAHHITEPRTNPPRSSHDTTPAQPARGPEQQNPNTLNTTRPTSDGGHSATPSSHPVDFDPTKPSTPPNTHHTPTSTSIGNDPTTHRVRQNLRNEGDFDVIFHADRDGNPQNNLTPKQIADAIRANPNYKPGTPVRLIACHAANNPDLARRLANELGAPVTVASDAVGVPARPDSPAHVRDNGTWTTHYPTSPDGKTPTPTTSQSVAPPTDLGNSPVDYMADDDAEKRRKREAQLKKANTNQEWFEKYYNAIGHRRSLKNRDEHNDPLPQLHPTGSNDPKWMLASDVPDAEPESYIDESDHDGERGERISKENLDRLDELAKAREEAIKNDRQPHKDRAAAKAEYEKDPSEANKAAFEAADAKHSPLHGAMTRASETYGDAVSELQAIPNNFAGAERIDNRGSGNNRFDQIWRLPNGEYVVVEVKGSPDAGLGDRRGLPLGAKDIDATAGEPGEQRQETTETTETTKPETAEVSPTPGVPKVKQGTREYFKTILHEMETRGIANLAKATTEAERQHANDELKLAADLKEALLAQPSKLKYMLVKAVPDGDRHGGYIMKEFDIRTEDEK